MANLKSHLNGFQPETAMVLGSGLGGLVDAVDVKVRVPYDEIDGFHPSGVSGHTAELIAGTIGGHPVAVLSGRVHYYENADAGAMRKPLESLKAAGINRIILTNSAGSLDEEMGPGSIMQIEDHINFSGSNPLFGEPTDARFVGLTNAYDEGMRTRFRDTADALKIPLHKGVYMWFSGPSFETPTEIRIARVFGANAVGMSTVPEVILARFLKMDVAAFSVVTNYAAGMTGQELGHDETKENAPKGGALLTKLISAVLEEGI